MEPNSIEQTQFCGGPLDGLIVFEERGRQTRFAFFTPVAEVPPFRSPLLNRLLGRWFRPKQRWMIAIYQRQTDNLGSTFEYCGSRLAARSDLSEFVAGKDCAYACAVDDPTAV